MAKKSRGSVSGGTQWRYRHRTTEVRAESLRYTRSSLRRLWTPVRRSEGSARPSRRQAIARFRRAYRRGPKPLASPMPSARRRGGTPASQPCAAVEWRTSTERRRSRPCRPLGERFRADRGSCGYSMLALPAMPASSSPRWSTTTASIPGTLRAACDPCTPSRTPRRPSGGAKPVGTIRSTSTNPSGSDGASLIQMPGSSAPLRSSSLKPTLRIACSSVGTSWSSVGSSAMSASVV